jgi:hypothetical protein
MEKRVQVRCKGHTYSEEDCEMTMSSIWKSRVVVDGAVATAFMLGLAVSASATPQYDWGSMISNYNEAAGGYEDFTGYGTANLNGKGPWTGDTGGNAYVQNGDYVQMKPKAVGAATYCNWDVADLTPASGLIAVGIRLQQGGGNETTNGFSSWGIEAVDTSGNIMAAIEGRKASVWGKVGSASGGSGPGPSATLTGAAAISAADWTPVWMIINTASKTVEFWYNDGTSHSLGSLNYSSYSSSTTLAKIRIASDGATWSTKPWTNGDNLTYGPVVPEPASLAGFASLAVFLLRRRPQA